MRSNPENRDLWKSTKMIGIKPRAFQWSRMFKFEPDDVFGLDIGSATVKTVRLIKDDTGWAVTAASIAEIEEATEENGQDIEVNTAKAIKECLKSAKVATKFAVCGVSGPGVAVRHFNFPSLPPEEIHGAVMLEAEQVCPFNIADCTIDYQLIPNEQDHIHGVLVTTTNKTIARKNQLANQASVDNVLMDVDSLALLNCFNQCQQTDPSQTSAILNVGNSYTNLVIVGENSLPFIRDISHAGHSIIKHISDEMELSPQDVRKVLSPPVEGEESSSQPNIYAHLGSACQRLILNINETLRYYATQKKAAVGNISVCGGFASSKGFIGLLNSQLPATAVLWNPFDKISNKAGEKNQQFLQTNGPAMAVAAGLAMRSIST